MNTPLLALIGYAAWAIVLVLALYLSRAALIMAGRKRITEYRGAPEPDGVLARLQRAHQNTVENLPIYGAVVLAGVLAQVDSPAFARLAVAVLALRAFQSCMHVLSTSVAPAAWARATAFGLQLAGLAAMMALVVAKLAL
jgi:uncharacterized MAPEG superfamily protein